MSELKRWVEQLCSPEARGRKAGSLQGRHVRLWLQNELKALGLEAEVQAVPKASGTNVFARVASSTPSDRWVLVGAHYDHLGGHGDEIFWGADDNAAAVAITLQLAEALKREPPRGRNVLLTFWDAEEPPHFAEQSMGSMTFVSEPLVPLSSIDLMVCMDLVGHAVGPSLVPREVRESMFVLGAERSEGTPALVDALPHVSGVVPRRADGEVIPPLSDHHAFWKQQVPFVFLTCGRWEHYHRPSDTPDKLDYPKMDSIARWLEGLTRAACSRPEKVVRFVERRDDRSTLNSLDSMLKALATVSPLAGLAREQVASLLEDCDANGAVSEERVGEIRALADQIENALSAT